MTLKHLCDSFKKYIVARTAKKYADLGFGMVWQQLKRKRFLQRIPHANTIRLWELEAITILQIRSETENIFTPPPHM